MESELQSFWDERFNLHVKQGIIMRGQQVVIPQSLRETVLEELHRGHSGMVRMKAIARENVYWPNYNKDIEAAARTCEACQENKGDPPRERLNKWETPMKPWQRVHIDYAGPFQNR